MNDNAPCMFFLRKPYPVASVVESCVMHINELARYITTLNQEAKSEQVFGNFKLSDYTPREQVALVLMRQFDDVARAVLARMQHSTVGAPDWFAMRTSGLAIFDNTKNLHIPTPRGKWIAGKVTKALADKFEIKAAEQSYPRIYTKAQREQNARSRYNWANR